MANIEVVWLLLECGTTRPALLAEVVVTWALFAVVVVVRRSHGGCSIQMRRVTAG